MSSKIYVFAGEMRVRCSFYSSFTIHAWDRSLTGQWRSPTRASKCRKLVTRRERRVTTCYCSDILTIFCAFRRPGCQRPQLTPPTMRLTWDASAGAGDASSPMPSATRLPSALPCTFWRPRAWGWSTATVLPPWRSGLPPYRYVSYGRRRRQTDENVPAFNNIRTGGGGVDGGQATHPTRDRRRKYKIMTGDQINSLTAREYDTYVYCIRLALTMCSIHNFTCTHHMDTMWMPCGPQENYHRLLFKTKKKIE